MSVPFDQQCSLWTFDEDPAWTDRNCGTSDRLLMVGLEQTAAMSGANHLADIYRGDTFEVRDVHNNVVHSACDKGARVSAGPDVRPKRRTLGQRGV